MQSYFDKVKEFLMELNYSITHEDREEEVFVVSHEEDGISSMVIGCADPILIMEQYLFELKKDDVDIYKALLQKNRDLVHGAFILDDSGKKVIFRDTLQIENLDLNELEASINALSLLLSEYSEELIEFSKK